ncbi:MAG: ribbon-helix-helix domain-containing protein [Actinomycetota bacterium]
MATVRITVRLPENLVAFVDGQVAGGGHSRATVVAQALERERRRKGAERDAMIYASTEPNPELVALAEWVATHPAPGLDGDRYARSQKSP